MSLPQSDTGHVARTAVLIPLRSLTEGKLRLASAYDAAARARLIDSMANTVLAAAHTLDALVVHDSSVVDTWARERGAMAFQPSAPGLNLAVTEAREHLRDNGYERVIVAHADLPLADDLRRMDLGSGISIVPDRHGDGTNVMCLPTGLNFTFAYGPGSFAAHLSIARDLGIEPVVLHDDAFSWDVDNPDDVTDSMLREAQI